MAGRPPKYKTVEALQEAIDCYFDSCKGEILENDDGMPVFDKNNKIVRINQAVPTITGLARALGFTTRQSLLNYQGKKQFLDTILRAKLRVEEYTETCLFDRNSARGAEFSLRCNFKWNDKATDNSEQPKMEKDALSQALEKLAGELNGN